MLQLRQFATPTKSPANATFALTRLDAISATPENAIDNIKKAGAVILERLVPPSSVAQTLKDVEEPLKKGYDHYKQDEFFKARTSRASGLLRLSPAYVHDQLMHPLLRRIADHFLTTAVDTKTPSGEPYRWEIPPQVSSCVAFQIDPGAESQILHRDDTIYLHPHKAIEEWSEPRDSNREATLSMFIAGTESTAENGATRLIPGSHLWDDDREPSEKESVHAELAPGDALIMLSLVYHGGSANTSKNSKRVVFASSIARGTLRQEENQCLTVPIEVMRQYPLEVQKFAGFRQHFPELGWVGMGGEGSERG